MPAVQLRAWLRQLWREQPIKPKGAGKWNLEMQAREGRVTAAALNATALDAHSDIRVDPDDIWTQARHIKGVFSRHSSSSRAKASRSAELS